MKRFLTALLLPAILLLAGFRAIAAEEGGVKKSGRTGRLAKVAAEATNQTLVNIGQVASWIYSDGKSANQPDGGSGLYFPRGNIIAAAIFQDGLVWGGKVNDGSDPAIRVGGQTFSIGTVPGAILSPGVAEDVNDVVNVDRVWRIRRDYATADLRQDAAELNVTNSASVTPAQIEAVRQQYAADWRDWPVHKGAPFYDAEGDGQYTPQFEDDGSPKVFPDADEPGIANADQVVWLVANDLSASAVQTMYGSPSIGLEMQATLWAYRRSDALGNIIFKQFRVIYKGTATTPANATIDSMYFCQWADPDLGAAGDDFVGCDTSLSLGYVYNSVSTDGNYAQVNLPPPASGYDFFAGPLVADPDGEAIFGLKRRPGFRNLPMTSFAYFAAGQIDGDPTRGGDYNGTLQWWNLLRGYRPRPENPPDPWRDPTNGNAITRFRVPGDPVSGSGWIDANPGDRRLLLSSGPFTMALGDTQEVVVAVLAALGSDRLSSVSVLKFTDRFAQEAFDNLFELPKPPQPPVLSATEFNGQILLNWGENPAEVAETEDTVDKGYAFQGYNIYQLPSAGAALNQGIKLATFDLVDEVTTIAQETFDQGSGLVLELPVQIGKNSGVQRTFVIERDRFRDKPLINGQTYFFAVAAYNYNGSEGLTTKTLESSPSVATVVPQTTKPGVRYQVARGDTLSSAHVGGLSDGSVTPVIVDPSKTQDATYEVTFDESGHWKLVNVTSGQELLTDQSNQSGDNNYLITEGLQVIVAGPPLAGLSFNVDNNNNRWLTGGNHGGEIFFGGVFLGANFNGSNLAAANYRNVRVEFFAKESFTDLNGNGTYDIGEPYQLAEGAGQIANLYSGFALNAFTGQAVVPFRAFDIEVDPPRQLDILVRDRDGNGQWDLHKLYAEDDPNRVDINGGDFQFNYVYILDTDYDPNRWNPTAGGQDFMVGHLSDGGPVQWNLWLDQRGTAEPLGAAFSMELIAPNVNTAADKFSFTSKAPVHSVEMAQADLAMVNVFPNPYRGFNRAEANRFNRFVTFSHLPERATIRIFTLAGVLVRTIIKDDERQFINWDLQNERNLPAASGIYLAHIEFPDLNEVKVLKLAIVREEQFLRNF